MMLRLALLSLVAAVLAACEGPTAAACRQYVEAWEALECTEGFEAGVDCRVYENYPCDASAYFECAEKGLRCEEGVPRDGFAACAELASCD